MLETYKNIKKLRLERGWTQTELAQRTGYADKGTISRIENGKVDQKMPVLTEVSIFPANTGFFITMCFYDYTMILRFWKNVCHEICHEMTRHICSIPALNPAACSRFTSASAFALTENTPACATQYSPYCFTMHANPFALTLTI